MAKKSPFLAKKKGEDEFPGHVTNYKVVDNGLIHLNMDIRACNPMTFHTSGRNFQSITPIILHQDALNPLPLQHVARKRMSPK